MRMFPIIVKWLVWGIPYFQTHSYGRVSKKNEEPTSVGQKTWSESHGPVTWSIWCSALTWETSISSFLCQVDTNLNLASKFRNTNWKMKIREQGGFIPESKGRVKTDITGNAMLIMHLAQAHHWKSQSIKKGL
jgi:hypothetical protein